MNRPAFTFSRHIFTTGLGKGVKMMNTASLIKRSEVISYNFMQPPCWLFDDQRDSTLSLPVKVAYTFLFNRCQLSQHNG